jgi:hypothetical protein
VPGRRRERNGIKAPARRAKNREKAKKPQEAKISGQPKKIHK